MIEVQFFAGPYNGEIFISDWDKETNQFILEAMVSTRREDTVLGSSGSMPLTINGNILVGAFVVGITHHVDPSGFQVSGDTMKKVDEVFSTGQPRLLIFEVFRHERRLNVVKIPKSLSLYDIENASDMIADLGVNDAMRILEFM